jgi:glycosyltransferase involved in cell wall biosynthesis
VTRVARAAADAATLWALLRNAHVEPRRRRTPLVSVVVATYNWSSVLRHAVASALRQTYPALEVIVVGDACTDDSGDVVRSFRDGRVRWENLERNSGSQSLPNNRGLELARGELVAYLGHDDLWLPGHVAHLVSTVERTGAGLAVAAVLSLGPPGSRFSVLSGLRPYAHDTGKPPTGILHRRDAVDAVGPWRDYRTLSQAPDREFVGRVAARFGTGYSTALTALKFPSAWRKDSYRLRRDDEQRAYLRRITRERWFVERELIAYLRLRARRPSPAFLDHIAAPEVAPPGSLITQLRRYRGLPDEPGS